MHGLFLILLAAAGTFVAADDGLKIEVTRAVTCDRKSRNGDSIAVNYNGTLTDGTSFDSSKYILVIYATVMLTPHVAYNGGKPRPFAFTIGNNDVIKG